MSIITKELVPRLLAIKGGGGEVSQGRAATRIGKLRIVPGREGRLVKVVPSKPLTWSADTTRE